jgi:hypothetical protein
MSPKQLVVAFVVAGIVSGSTATAFGQAPPPGQYPPPAAGQYPPTGQYPPPGQYPHPAQYPPGQYPPTGNQQGYYGQNGQPLNPGPTPPASAGAPNGEYVAPLSQTTQPAYVPQSVALSGPRFIKDWEEGQPIPYGYHEETRVRKGVVISGAVVFGVLYLYNAFFASIGEDASSATGNENKLGWLYLPVLGPFLEMSETSSSTAHFLLVLDGVAQGVGVTMVISALMYPKHLLVRNDLATMTVVPMKIGMDGEGLGIVGRF